jgi:methylated-DNA-[protein]-cysteine S-methyltransferase
MKLINHKTSVNHSPLHLSIGLLPSSPIGSLWVAASPSGLVAVDWSISRDDFIGVLYKRFHAAIISDPLPEEPLSQLREYLGGHRKQFNLGLDLSQLSSFQQQVLSHTAEIPYGQTSTYKEIASLVGNTNAARAVGRVEATNPIPIIIPCHRVLGTDGSLHGYGGPGGIKLKAWLLDLERRSA